MRLLPPGTTTDIASIIILGLSTAIASVGFDGHLLPAAPIEVHMLMMMAVTLFICMANAFFISGQRWPLPWLKVYCAVPMLIGITSLISASSSVEVTLAVISTLGAVAAYLLLRSKRMDSFITFFERRRRKRERWHANRELILQRAERAVARDEAQAKREA